MTGPDRFTDPPTVRIAVQYREIGEGPDSVEVTWEGHVPDCTALVKILEALLHRGRT